MSYDDYEGIAAKSQMEFVREDDNELTFRCKNQHTVIYGRHALGARKLQRYRNTRLICRTCNIMAGVGNAIYCEALTALAELTALPWSVITGKMKVRYISQPDLRIRIQIIFDDYVHDWRPDIVIDVKKKAYFGTRYPMIFRSELKYRLLGLIEDRCRADALIGVPADNQLMRLHRRISTTYVEEDPEIVNARMEAARIGEVAGTRCDRWADECERR